MTENQLGLSRWVVEEVLVAVLVPHPLSAEIFGQLASDRLKDLRDDIAEHGLNNPLELDAHGRVIKGSQRLKAIRELGWARVPVIRRSDLVDEQEIEEALIKDNTLRRQLTPAQVFRAGMRLEQIYSVRAERRKRAGVALPEGEGKVERHERSTVGKVARDLGVSRSKYEATRRVFGSDDQDMKDRVERGEIKLSIAAQKVKRPAPRMAVRDDVRGTVLRFARWDRECLAWIRQVEKLGRWVRDNDPKILGAYEEKAGERFGVLREEVRELSKDVG